ncbi:MAG: hypothetical protein P4L90_02450 [Rhodopila sp.]|nr:hypothetical protein [Rhodopila sp.]
MQKGRVLIGRIVLAAVTFWALLMIVPDFHRVIQPLASTGFAADNDGLIYDVTGPFPQEADSPASQAGLRVGDRLDLPAMHCGNPENQRCIDLLAVLGGLGGAQLVRPGRVLRLQIVPAAGGAARVVDVAAKPIQTTWLERGVLLFDEVIATLFILAAAWLVWTRPGGMTWGFFLYAVWFNSGQNFVFYTFLQERPHLLLAQEAAGAVLQGLGYAGFLLFVLRVPSDRTFPAWRGWQFALPLVALLFIGLQLLSYGSAFGQPSETVSRATFLAGFAVDAAAILILLRRRRGQPPQEYQRLRWVIWGCVIGLPAFIVAAILQSTTLWRLVPGVTSVPPELVAALYGLHGLFGWFVFEAVRRPHVVSVSIPLRRISVFGLMLSVPALFLHQQIEHLDEWLDLPPWSFVVLGSVLIFLIGRIHELGVELADRVFHRAFRRELAALRAATEDVLHATSIDAVDRTLTVAPTRTLDLASAAVFRCDGVAFRRRAEAIGWGDGNAERLDPDDTSISMARSGLPFPIHPADALRLGLPMGLASPTVAVPVRDRLTCHALALYGPHATGADLSRDEQAMLARLAEAAALAYRHVEADALRRQVATLRTQTVGLSFDTPGG